MIRDVHHVGIAVRDMEAALALYRDALALPCVKEGEAAGHGARGAVLAAGRSYVEVLQPVEESSSVARHIRERGEGLHHVALWSDDVEGDVGRLQDKAPPADAAPRAGFTGRAAYLTPEAFDGVLLEVVEPSDPLRGDGSPVGPITRIDHVVFRVPDVAGFTRRFGEWFGVPVKRTFERGGHTFAFMRPGDVVLEVIGPSARPEEPRPGYVAGLAFETDDIGGVTGRLKALGYPVGEPHPALQGGRIVSVHHTGACGVPLAFIDFTGSPGPAHRR